MQLPQRRSDRIAETAQAAEATRFAMSENGTRPNIFLGRIWSPLDIETSRCRVAETVYWRRETTGLRERIVANCSGKQHVEQTLERFESLATRGRPAIR